MTQPKPWCSCWCQCVVTQPRPWCPCWCQCVVTQPRPWCSCWCQCVVAQPKPWCSCWCHLCVWIEILHMQLFSCICIKMHVFYMQCPPPFQAAAYHLHALTLPCHTDNRQSLEIQGTALGKSLQAWTCIYRSTPAGVAQSRHAFVGGTLSAWARWQIPINKRQHKCWSNTHCSRGTCGSDSRFPQLVV